MPMVPLPFVVALLLGLLLLRMMRGEPAAASRWMIILISAYAAQAVLLGLHWGYRLHQVLPLQSILAAALPPLSWLAFRSFVAVNRHVALHALPPLLVGAFWVLAPWFIDLALAVIFLSYGVALLHLAWQGPDALSRATLDGAVHVSHALWATGIMAVISPGIDLMISLDLMRDHGRHAPLISSASSLISIGLLGWAAVVAGKNAPAPATELTAAADLPGPDPGDGAIVAALDALMRERALHHDPNLSLDRLARRMGLPARTVSSAINRVRGMNVSQYVNGHRVADACRLLTESKIPITQILLDVGFQTKSNFNREFLRVTGINPSAWRQQAMRQSTPSGSPAAASG